MISTSCYRIPNLLHIKNLDKNNNLKTDDFLKINYGLSLKSRVKMVNLKKKLMSGKCPKTKPELPKINF